MKKVDNTLINNLARLAKLDFETNSLGKIKEDLEKIILFIKKLDDIDTRDVKPLIYINTENNKYREDVLGENFSQIEALKNAPKKDSDYFLVSRVLNK